MIISQKILVETRENSKGLRIATSLRESGIYAVSHKTFTEEVFQEIEKDRVNALLIDASAEEMAEEFEAMLLMRQTNVRIFVMTPETAPPVLEKNGILFVSASLGLSAICDLIRYCLTGTGQKMENAIARTLLFLGIQPNLKGYRYLCTAVEKVICNRDLMENFNHELYGIIGKIYNVTPISVERSMRHAIDLAYERTDEKKLEQFFGYKIGKPCNTEFVAQLAERIRLAIL